MKRILITDDSSIMRRNLHTILTEAGYEVIAQASNGEEALQAYRKFHPDLITMDITMPIMDGLETVKRIISEAPNAKIIVISAFDQRSMLFEAMENGAKQYLIKPITADKLLAVVKQMFLEDTLVTTAHISEDLEVSPEAGPFFTVENEDGRFFITLKDPIRQGPYTDLQTALQGLLFVKPLSVSFRFSQATDCHPMLVETIEALIVSIRQAGGQVSVTAGQEQLAATLRRALSAPIETE